MSVNNFKVAIIFSLAAILPVPLVLLVWVFNGDITGTFHFIIRHTEVILPYYVFPSVAAFMSAFLLGGKIKYDTRKKYGNLGQCIIISILIVLISLVLWAFATYFVAQNHEKWQGFKLALYATTIFGWAVYPPGLLAGYIVWRSNKNLTKISS